jgi:hypothetical protein
MPCAFPSIVMSAQRSALCIQCRETSALWVSVDVPVKQPPGVYTGEVCISAVKTETE